MALGAIRTDREKFGVVHSIHGTGSFKSMTPTASLATKRNLQTVATRSLASQPGEIIFYESASVIHGRPESFQGDSFTNIFVHFAPLEGWTVSSNDVNKAAREGARTKSKEGRAARLVNE